ncbi:MAG: HDIG domain-containing protein [Leptolyngbya sp. SIOISBB]|nr:HDIG domain-containing protein [Leptolyngbya sp. SIOISBB]
MNKIWRWMRQIDLWSPPQDRPEEEYPPVYSVDDRPLETNDLYPVNAPRPWPWQRLQNSLLASPPLPPSAQRNRPCDRTKPHRIRPAIALTISILALTAAMGQRYYRQPELQVGTLSPKTVIAPENASVVDQETTEAERTAARNGAVPVLVPNLEANQSIQNSLDNLLKQAEILRDQAGDFPLLDGRQLPTVTQTYIREAPAAAWSPIWSVVIAVATELRDAETPTSPLALLTRHEEYQALTTEQQKVARDLVRYQQLPSALELESLQLIFETARDDFRKATAEFDRLAQVDRAIPDTPVLFRLSDSEWRTVRQQVRRTLDLMLLQGIPAGVQTDLLAIAAREHLQGKIPSEAQDLGQGLIMAVLEPNLVKDLEKTRAKAEAAAEQVPAVIVNVQAGDIIVRQGKEIDQSAFILLDHFGLSQRRLNVWGLLGFGVLMGGGVALFLMVERTRRPGLRGPDYVLVSCMILGVSGLSILGFAVYSLPAVGLLASSFYGTALGSTLVGLIAILLPIGTRVNPVPLLASAAGGLVCSLIAPRLRSREELALLGGVVGIIQGAVYLALTWMLSPVVLSTWYLPLTGAIMQGIYGVVSSVIALGLSPYLEHVFDLVTPIRLAELSSPNRPMLQRLASEAPGTFQHTLFVASLAEAAARSLHCNVELVRAGTLYHDIGKMHDPQGFIENQMGGPNKHDKIDDPWVSADIIKKHVSQGLVMARRCRLPRAVQAFIPEHQGTMLISYFHHRAVEMAKTDPNIVVEETDFRYDGPIPQSPETGIVMLADSCEAALRSLKEASPSEALAMVNRILKARWRDGQLVDSGLNREHMSIIAQVFVQVWQQYNHKRIAYPKSVLNPLAGRS